MEAGELRQEKPQALTLGGSTAFETFLKPPETNSAQLVLHSSNKLEAEPVLLTLWCLGEQKGHRAPG